MEYLILLLYSILVGLQYKKKPNFSRYKAAWLIIFFYCVLLFGFRYRVGIDTLNYMYGYDEQPRLEELNLTNIFDYKAAPFYTLLNAVCRSITHSFYLLQIIVSFIFNSCLFVFLCFL